MKPLDGRRRRYVPVDTLVAFSPFGSKLYDKWAMEGLCTWMLLLAAAKREPVQGVFTYTSEAEAWTKLGATATSFTFDAFLTFCGRNKQTRKRHSGRITYVTLTSWAQWNKAYKTQQDDERNPSTPPQNTAGDLADIQRNSGGDTAAKPNTESEGDPEGEAEHFSANYRIPDPHARLLSVLTDKTALTVERIASMHKKHHFAQADFEEAFEAAGDPSCRSPSAVAIGVLKKRVEARAA